VTAPQQAMDAIDSTFASHLRHRTLRATGVLKMTHAPLFHLRVKATFPPDIRELLLRTNGERVSLPSARYRNARKAIGASA
jgi:hypothetical protein